MIDVSYTFDKFDKIQENYPVDQKRKVKMKFIETCLTILYSNDNRKVQNCYNSLFTEFRRYIITGSECIRVSCFEEVIVKILNDAEKGLYEQYGVQNSPFLRFIALIKESEAGKNNWTRALKDQQKFNLKWYILMFIDGQQDRIKNNYIRRLIHQYFSEL